MNMTFLWAAFALMAIIIVREILKNKYNIDMDKINIAKSKANLKMTTNKNLHNTIKKNTGNCTLVLVDCGNNKATVMATLRQITGIDYNSAKEIVNSTPSVIMENISEKEADMNKKALEYVGAQLEIK